MTSSDAARQGLKLSESCIRDSVVAEQRTTILYKKMSAFIFSVQQNLLLVASRHTDLGENHLHFEVLPHV